MNQQTYGNISIRANIPRIYTGIAAGSITIFLANRYIATDKYRINHALLCISLGVIAGLFAYDVTPPFKLINPLANKPKSFELELPTYNYDKRKYMAKVLTPLIFMPDGTYDAGWTGYSLFIKSNGGIFEAKTDDGVRCPFPIPVRVLVSGGQGFILREECNKDTATDTAICGKPSSWYKREEF